MRGFLPIATLATAALFLGCQEQQCKIAFESRSPLMPTSPMTVLAGGIAHDR